MRTIIIILALVALVAAAGCGSQQQGDNIESRRQRHLDTLRQIYGDDSDFRIARAIESRIQRMEYEKRTK